jgi:MFS family permease
LTDTATSATTAAPRAESPWSPFARTAFAVLWTATVISNIGTWMQSAASGWLMTSLDPDPLMVALVQLATALPMFLLALPGGAIADIVDRRRLLLRVELAITVVIAFFSIFVALDEVSPVFLLFVTACGGAAAALIAPAWQSIVPLLVGRAELPPAVALNSIGINVSRAVGPALAGAVIAWLGIAAPFWLNAVSNLAVIAALLWWREPSGSAPRLPPERFIGAMVIGLRHARNNAALRDTLKRAAVFFPLASAYWALLPLVAREKIHGGPATYGLLLGTIGLAAIAGALLLPRLKNRLGAHRIATCGMLGTALALALFSVSVRPAVAFAASAVAGISWIAVMAPLNVSALVVLPAWVRGRGVAVYATVMFGGLTLGSLIWGQVAASYGIRTALLDAAVLLALAVPLTRRWKLATGTGVDLSPSMQWPAPVIAHDVPSERGPVLVTVDYLIRPADRVAFLAAMDGLRQQRRRLGAYDWDVFEDTAREGRFLETFRVDSWLEHLRQHERVTAEDTIVQAAASRFHSEGTPRVTHLIAARPSDL